MDDVSRLRDVEASEERRRLHGERMRAFAAVVGEVRAEGRRLSDAETAIAELRGQVAALQVRVRSMR
jgi:conjugal transfer/entry exclusion protein